MRRRFILFIVLVALGAGLLTQRTVISDWYQDLRAPALPVAVGYEEIATIEFTPPTQSVTEESTKEEPATTVPTEPVDVMETDDPVHEPDPVEPADSPVIDESTLPASINLAVPFTSQAPHGVWAEPYKESCEEASVYMVHAYYQGQPEGKIPPDQADQELVKIVAFENELFGYYEDTTAEQTGVFAELMFGHRYELIENPTVEQIKTHLAQGRPVIVPAAGRLLRNPYFTAPGPIYHMLVIRGYTEQNQFIANDPGTSRGEAYLYDVDALMSAIHDWNQGAEITEGRKVVLILHP